MGFQGLIDEDIKRKLASSQGIARPGAESYLMDLMSVAPTMLGFPVANNIKDVLNFTQKLMKKKKGIASPSGKDISNVLRKDTGKFLKNKGLVAPEGTPPAKMENWYNPTLKNKVTEFPGNEKFYTEKNLRDTINKLEQGNFEIVEKPVLNKKKKFKPKVIK